MLRQNWVTVDLQAIRHNYHLLADTLPKDVRVMAVVKADAYGHGALAVAQTVLAEGAGALAVALVEEGITLREAGVFAPILVLGAATETAAEAAIEHDLAQTVFYPHQIEYIERAAQRVGKPARVHVKLDTGMGRIGLRTEEEAKALAEALQNAAHVQATGVYTHFSDADAPLDGGAMNPYTQAQLERFMVLRRYFPAEISSHVSNSAMSLLYPEARFQMVREGITLYGYPPIPTHLPFCPALSWQTEVVHVKDVEAGSAISYNCTYVAKEPRRVATLAVGYGDGYHRALSNRGAVLIGGKRCAILGRVCMDQMMADVSDVPDVRVGDPVVLIGRQGDEFLGADEVARWADTISYEVLLAITARVPRKTVG